MNISKKGTIIAIVLLAVFVVGGIIGAVVGNEAYLEKQEALITNYSMAEDASFRMRKDQSLVYRYADDIKQVRLSDFIRVSDGATYAVKKVLDENKKVLGRENLDIIDTTYYPHLYLFVEVKSHSQNKKSSYVLEIVSESNYKMDTDVPFSLVNEGPIQIIE